MSKKKTTDLLDDIEVDPIDDKIKVLEAMSNQPYTPAQQLSEFIDNSKSARIPGQPVCIDIDIIKDPVLNKCVLKIKDDGKGIGREYFALVIGKGNSIGGGENNEHGMGLKAAAISGGCYLKTFESCVHDPQGIKTPSYVAHFKERNDLVQKFKVSQGSTLSSHGTYLEIVLPDNHPLTTKEGYYQALSELQKSYHSVLGTQQMVIKATNSFLKLKTELLEPDSAEEFIENPIYGNKSWVVEKLILSGTTEAGPWEAHVQIGFLPDNGSALNKIKEAGVGQDAGPLDISLYQRTEAAQGIYISKGDHLISHTSWALMGGNSVLVNSKKDVSHHNYNGLIVNIDLVKGLATQPTKNGLAPSPAAHALVKDLRAKFLHIIPDEQDDLVQASYDVAKSMALSKHACYWNGAVVEHRAVVHPSQDIPWTNVSTQKIYKDKQSWTTHKSFGDWKVWSHCKENLVVVMHKDGTDTSLELSDIPAPNALEKYIASVTTNKNIMLVHDTIQQFLDTDYGPHTTCKPVLTHTAPRSIRQAVAKPTPVQKTLSHVAPTLAALNTSPAFKLQMQDFFNKLSRSTDVVKVTAAGLLLETLKP